MFQNAWPQEKRNLILKKMRSCFAFSISGGSNLGRITQHGVSKPRDAVFNFTPPPLVNKIPVRWYPSALSKNWNNNMYNRDGFNNFVNVDRLAYFTTTDSNNVSPPQGYGIVTIDVCSGSIIVDCISATKNTMEGFPFQFNKANNFPFDDKHFLPNLRISGLNKTALLQIFDVRTGECVYTIRLNSNTFRPQVPYKGKFKVIVSSPDSNSQIIENEVNSVGENDTSVLEFRF